MDPDLAQTAAATALARGFLLQYFWLPLALAVIAVPLALFQYGRQKQMDREMYRFQKETDREMEIRKEKRAAFTAFVRALDRLINHRQLGDAPTGSDAILKAKEALNELYLRSTAENMKRFEAVLDAASKLSNSLEKPDTTSKTFADLAEAYNAALTAAVNGARGEFGVPGQDADPLSQEAIYALVLTQDQTLERATDARAFTALRDA